MQKTLNSIYHTKDWSMEDDYSDRTKPKRGEKPEVPVVFDFTPELNNIFFQWSGIQLESMVEFSSRKHILED